MQAGLGNIHPIRLRFMSPMTSPSRRALVARALAFRGLPNQLVDPLSTQLVKLVTALAVGGLLVSALRCIEEVAVDLVVTDFYMPEVDGAELTRVLRQMECNVPVVAITVANSAEQQESLWQSGVDLVLSKPVSTQALTSAMQRFMAA